MNAARKVIEEMEPEVWRRMNIRSRWGKVYFVSTLGRIYNSKRRVFLFPSSRGHISLPGRPGTRLCIFVLETFVGPCPPGYEGCHKDDNQLNNRLNNIYWGTKSQNAKDKIKNGRQRGGFCVPKFSEAEAERMSRLVSAGWSLSKVGRAFGCTHHTVANYVRKTIRIYATGA